MTLEIGQILQNRYRVVSRLGEGGMGAVYRAWNTRLNVPVALKEMMPQPGLDSKKLAQLRQLFRREAQILARLDHPHLVDVTDFFAEAGDVYLVMKFIKGESLAQRIERQGALPEEEVLRLADQLLDALDYCHDQGVIHRDVKPENVIIRSPTAAGGPAKAILVDFGLVKLWDPDDPRTKTAMRGMGTPEYAPPEQYDLQMGHTDARSDVYSLGATMYHALTGQTPPTATQRIASRNAFQPPRALNRRISDTMEAVVLQAMELTVEDRFQNAREMRRALAEGGGRPGEPLPPISPERKALPTWIWALGGAAALAALGLIAALAWPRGVAEVTPTATMEKAVLTAQATVTEVVAATSTPKPSPLPTTVRPTRTPGETPTHAATSTPIDTATPEASATPTGTPSATPMPTTSGGSTPTATPVRSATTPQLVSPEQGGTYQSPVTFRWSGSLQPGQAYQVTARHAVSGHVIQSGSLTGESWAASLPAEQHGDWRWTVSVVQGGTTVATSSEGMFWFDPNPGGDGDDDGGDGNGDGDEKPTPRP